MEKRSFKTQLFCSGKKEKIRKEKAKFFVNRLATGWYICYAYTTYSIHINDIIDVEIAAEEG